MAAPTKEQFRIEARFQPRCANPLCETPHATWQPHHTVYAQHIRAIDPTLEWDPRNALRLCVDCHARQHNRQGTLSVKLLRPVTLTFAVELMGEGKAHNYFARYYDPTGCDVSALLRAA